MIASALAVIGLGLFFVVLPHLRLERWADCIRVVMFEEWWHHRYADRDLDLLASRAGGS
jgi:hypothetical protein